MLIGILSDTHDHVKNIKIALHFFDKQNVDFVFHCGDWVSPFIFKIIFLTIKPKAHFKGVLGNKEGDIFMTLERIKQFSFPIDLNHQTLTGNLEGKKYIIYHGQDKILTQSLIDSQKFDLVFTGHTHIPKITRVGKTIHINPGTASDAANFKVIDNPTLALYDSKTNKAKIIEFLKEV